MTTSDLLARDRTQLVQSLQDMGLDVSNFDISHRHDSEFHDREQARDFSGASSASREGNESKTVRAESNQAASTGAIDIIA